MKVVLPIVLLCGAALAGCGETEGTQADAAEASLVGPEEGKTNVAEKSDPFASNPEFAGAMTCHGDTTVTHHGYPQDSRNVKTGQVSLLRVRPASNQPVAAWLTDEKRFAPVCDYDCQFMGSADDYTIRSGYSQARNATTAMGSTITLFDSSYKHGKLRTSIDHQEMTPMGPTRDVVESSMTCEPGVKIT